MATQYGIRFRNVQPVMHDGRHYLYSYNTDGTVNKNDITPGVNRFLRITGGLVTTACAVTAGTAAAALAAPAAVISGASAVAGIASRELVHVDSYHRADGTHVSSHQRTPPDDIESNNFSY